MSTELHDNQPLDDGFSDDDNNLDPRDKEVIGIESPTETIDPDIIPVENTVKKETPETEVEDTDTSAQKEVVDDQLFASQDNDHLKGPAPKHDNVLVKYDIFSAIDPKKTNALAPLVLIPKRLSRTGGIEAWGIEKDDIKSDQVMEYIRRFLYGAKHFVSGTYTEAGFYETALDAEDSEWVQEIHHNGSVIGFRQQRDQPGKTETVRLRGKAVGARMSSLSGNGKTVRTSLLGTGLDIMLKPRDDIDFLTLDHMIARDKVNAGFDTAGLVFQASQYGLVGHVWDFCQESITQVNLKEYQEDDQDLSEVIRINDLPIIYHAVGSANFPYGYPIDLPCSAPPTQCGHIERLNLNVNRTLWLNRKGLSTAQMDMLGKFRHLFTLKDVEEYQTLGRSRFIHTFDVMLGENKLSITLEVPTIATYLRSGEIWINEITQVMNRVLAKTDPETIEERRKALVEDAMRLSFLREYGHFFKEIRINDREIIDEPPAIIIAITELSRIHTDREVSDTIVKELQLFIERSSLALVAIPNYSCPKCGRDFQDPETLQHPELAPLDAIKLFFALGARLLLRRGQAAFDY